MTQQSGRSPFLVLVCLLAAIIAMPAVVLADRDDEDRADDFVKHALHGLLHHKKDLNLSDEQVSKLKPIVLNYTKTHIKGEADIKLTNVDALALIMDENSDLGAIEKALQQHERAETALHLESVKAMRTAMAVLTPEQKENWKPHLGQFRKKRHEED